MTLTAQHLYDLLPAIYRIRDAERGEPLKALLALMAEQISAVEENIDDLYENWFIETCEEWLVPYIGDLLGVRPLESATGEFSLRAYVANTLAYRRRKGTVAVLEELARDVTGRPARAVEFFDLLAASQHLNHLRPGRPASLSVSSRGSRESLEHLGGPFEKAAHTVDVRRIESGRGKYNLPHVGLYLWRLKAYRMIRGDARRADDAPDGCWRFSPLGYDAPLFNTPQTEEDLSHPAGPVNVPGVLRRFPLYLELEARRSALTRKAKLAAGYFGKNPVFEIFPDGAATPLAPDEIVIGNLQSWHRPGWQRPNAVFYGPKKTRATRCVVDPERGRLAFVKGLSVKNVSVTFNYGFSGNVGAGPYDRRRSVAGWHHPETQPVTWHREVSAAAGGTSLKEALEQWNAHVQHSRAANGIICLTDNGSYRESLPDIILPARCRLAIVAALCTADPSPAASVAPQLSPDHLRPHILSDLVIVAPPGARQLRSGVSRGELILDGLLVEGSLSVASCDLGGLHLAHCTFASRCKDQKPWRQSPSLTIASGNTGLNVVINASLLETVRSSETITLISISDSLIDGGATDAMALAGLAGNAFGPPVSVERSTIRGRSAVRELWASETIFTGEPKVERCQTGCMRFCYLALPDNPAAAPSTPPRYRCQPCLEIAEREERQKAKPFNAATVRKQVSLWLAPSFETGHPAHPAYGGLGLATPTQIREGAEDGSEMGVFCSLKFPRREANLRAIWAEYLRSGLAAGVFYVREENHSTPGGST